MRITKHPGIVVAMILAILVATDAFCENVMSVQVKNSAVRSTPTFLGKVVGQLNYGDQVTAVNEKDGWIQIQAKGREGWMHESALTRKKIVFSSGSEQVGKYATTDEVALAGKGFNQSVEKAYRSRNPKLNYQGVDRMESIQISQKDIQRFIQEGGLTAQGGAQ